MQMSKLVADCCALPENVTERHHGHRRHTYFVCL